MNIDARSFLRRIILLLPLLSMTLFFVGCATPKVVVDAPDIHKYRKVYIGIPEQDPRKVYPRVLARLKQCQFDVVEVQPDGPVIGSQGSGFVFTPKGHLLTCAHIIKGTDVATIWLNGTRYPAKVLATDTNLDVALLQVAGQKPFKHLTFAPNKIYRMGQEVFTMGFPLVEILGTSPRLNKGLVSSTVGMEDNPKQIQISAEVQPGNSGGPLLDADGAVIGLVIATLNPMNVLIRSGGSLPQNVNFGIKNDAIWEFVRGAGVELPAPDGKPIIDGFESARDSLAIVRAGDVRDEDLTTPSVVCLVKYLSLWDVWYRFRAFHMEFRDLKTGTVVLKAGQYRDDPFSSEDGVLDRTFAEIYPKFFPDHANPFKGTKVKPTPESQ
jgi:serine protease Do